MATPISTGIDVITFLEEQHEQIKILFNVVISSEGKAKQEAFTSLRRLLAVHETAEEEIIHPAARRALPNGDTLVDARLLEENEAKKVLAKLEKLDVDSPEFDGAFTLLQRGVLVHAQAEEREEFTRLEAALAPEQLDRMRRAVELAEKMAPTRPHPGVESATANVMAGPFAAMIDRVRDALTGKSIDREGSPAE
jgi:hemerythrin superfamily protein